MIIQSALQLERLVKCSAASVIPMLSAATIFAGSANSQEPPKGEKKRDAQSKRDPQNAIEPRSGPGVGQEFLKKFEGEWTVEKSFFRQGGEGVKSMGTCTQKMIHGGRFLQSDFKF